jgi:hypothetical protein
MDIKTISILPAVGDTVLGDAWNFLKADNRMVDKIPP